MSGFPTRPSPTSFGAKRQDRTPPRSSIYDIGAAFVNLVRWTLSGLGQSAPRAWALCTVSGTTITLTAQGNAWHGSAPTPARSSTGVYTLTYAATYADADDALVSPNLLAAIVCPKAGANARTADWSIADGRVVTVRLFRAADGAPEDGSFMVTMY